MEPIEKKADNTWIFSMVLVGCIALGVIVVALKLLGIV